MSSQAFWGRALGFLLAFGLVALSGCGGYAVRLESVRLNVENDNLPEAAAAIDTLIAAAEAGESPQDRDLPLLLLERAAIRQAMQGHDGAVADLTGADPMLEVLDLSPDRAGDAATYLFSENRTLYRPPVYEKLMVNVMACSSFLAMGRGSSAMVEARRIGTLLDYFEQTELVDHPMLGAAAYVAGMAMEFGDDSATALRFYLDAYRRGDAPGLAHAVARTAWGTRFNDDPDVLRAREALGLDANEAPRPAPDDELVTLVFSGLAPYRAPERIPVGIVFAWMRANVAYELGADDAAYGRIVAEGLLTWVNFPVLVQQQNPYRRFDVQSGGITASARQVADIESFALQQWELDRPGVAWSAITRAITRVLAREAIQAAGRAAGGAGQTIGFIAGLAAQGAMQAADTPDTRTWTLMPASLWVARQPRVDGADRVTVTARGVGVGEQQVLDLTGARPGRVVRVVRFFH
jgi:uncharacterized protein